MKKKCAVFSCLGLGDGLIALVLSNNLSLNGYDVTTFHPFLNQLQRWFPHLKIAPFPKKEMLPSILSEYERFFIPFEKSEWMQEIIQFCEKHYPERTIIINPIATSKTNYPYWENGRFNGNLSFVDNLQIFCRDILKLSHVVKTNGIKSPDFIRVGQHSKRVVIHPTSSRPGKNWPLEKYLALSNCLRDLGYDPALVLTAKEKKELNLSFEIPDLPSLEELAAFVAESGYMIGNDSGIGHLASCLGLPTLTICRNAKVANFWRPSWSKGLIVTPSSFVPNLKGLRWRDKHWKKWIPVRKVKRAFFKLS
jgi:heptosyltransferase III